MPRVKSTSKENTMWRSAVIVRADIIRAGGFGVPASEKVRKVGDGILIRIDEVDDCDEVCSVHLSSLKAWDSWFHTFKLRLDEFSDRLADLERLAADDYGDRRLHGLAVLRIVRRRLRHRSDKRCLTLSSRGKLGGYVVDALRSLGHWGSNGVADVLSYASFVTFRHIYTSSGHSSG
jgi:hypothetical protein